MKALPLFFKSVLSGLCLGLKKKKKFLRQPSVPVWKKCLCLVFTVECGLPGYHRGESTGCSSGPPGWLLLGTQHWMQPQTSKHIPRKVENRPPGRQGAGTQAQLLVGSAGRWLSWPAALAAAPQVPLALVLSVGHDNNRMRSIRQMCCCSSENRNNEPAITF